MQALNNTASLWYFLPELALTFFFLAVFIFDLPKSFREVPRLGARVSVVGLIVYLALTVYGWEFPSALAFHGMIVVDPFTNFFRIFGGMTALVVVFLSAKSKEVATAGAEYWAMILGIVIGMPMLAAANNLLMIYLAMELVSILSYILVGYIQGSRHSAEAALKYVLYGATASGIMIYGLSLIFGVTGTLQSVEIRQFLLSNPAERVTLFVGLLMAFAGFGFKISAVPFHMWAPDVYQGAPTPVAAFLSVGPKAAGFAIILRFVFTALTQNQGGEFISLKFLDISSLLAVFAIATMVVGNLLAIQQKNIKRFLAYSSIAHAGYMLMAAAALNTAAIQAVLFYLVSYFIMNLGAFSVAIYVSNALGTQEIEGYRGLSKRPGKGFLVSFVMALFMVSLTGIPPTVGFVGKFYLFSATLHAHLYGLAVVGVLNSVISLYYYLRIVKNMFFDEAPDDKPLASQGWGFSGLLVGFSILTLVLGLYWKYLDTFSAISSKIWM